MAGAVACGGEDGATERRQRRSFSATAVVARGDFLSGRGGGRGGVLGWRGRGGADRWRRGGRGAASGNG